MNKAREDWLKLRVAEILERRFGHLDFWRLPKSKATAPDGTAYIYTKQGVYDSVARELVNMLLVEK